MVKRGKRIKNESSLRISKLRGIAASVFAIIGGVLIIISGANINANVVGNAFNNTFGIVIGILFFLVALIILETKERYRTARDKDGSYDLNTPHEPERWHHGEAEDVEQRKVYEKRAHKVFRHEIAVPRPEEERSKAEKRGHKVFR